MRWIYVTECLYRKCDGGTIYIRIAGADGRPVMRSTHEKKPVKAKAFLERWRDEKKAQRYGTILPGPSVQDKMLTVNDLIDDYVKAGYPKRTMQPKPADTVERERRHFKSLREWWGIRNPHGINLGDCDAYKDWRLSGGFISSYEIRGHKHTKRAPGGTRAVDIELCTLSSVFHLARRRGRIRNNPLQGRSSFVPAGDVKHCREFAPTPKELHDIEQWLRDQGRHDVGDFASFLAFTGLRIGEALRRCWSEVNWEDEVMDVKRSKKGVFPWVAITPALSTLLLQMKRRAEEEELVSDLMFPPMRGIFEGNRKRDASAIRRWLKKACTALNIRHVTPHGLRSYFVTSCRSTLTDAEIAMAIGDKSGPSLISSTYGDVRPDAFLAQIRTIQQRWISDTATGTDSK